MPLSPTNIIGIVVGGVALCLFAATIWHGCAIREGQGTGPYLNPADNLGGGPMWDMDSRSEVGREEDLGGTGDVEAGTGGAENAGGKIDIEQIAEGGAGIAL
ncbi:uncharacterized protein PAC_05569 [Phialocephala subalpina]|uniref:Uncharacterized protein n=1 Tax=Phialocephala subalpina TaxID=576137 RepID=A0A1L7WSC8_9HELO|nr:uncharacterized protein PAC_05569 [Phialocephala subalpina]